MDSYRIGVISDTHGLLRVEAINVIKNSQLIIHAGDIGKLEVVQNLRNIAPVICVKGNCDRNNWSEDILETQCVNIEGISIYVIHDIKRLDFNPEDLGFHIVVSGHSHKPLKIIKNNILFLNPGSAGPKRFKLPVSVALIDIKDKKIDAKIIEIECH